MQNITKKNWVITVGHRNLLGMTLVRSYFHKPFDLEWVDHVDEPIQPLSAWLPQPHPVEPSRCPTFAIVVNSLSQSCGIYEIK